MKDQINFDSTLPELVLDYLSSNYTINNCLTRCNNHGQCFYSNTTNSLLCKCNTHYEGETCEYDTRPCSSNPCLNSGQCVNDLINKTFSCQCSAYYEGRHCEWQIDLCKNETCSNRGYCQMKNNTIECKCFKG